MGFVIAKVLTNKFRRILGKQSLKLDIGTKIQFVLDDKHSEICPYCIKYFLYLLVH